MPMLLLNYPAAARCLAVFIICCQACSIGSGAEALNVNPGDMDPGDQARRILTDAGVQGGLIVHVGCGDGTLTAALRADDGYVVHGLDADPANIEKARRTIHSLDLDGQVSVEPWAHDRLPHTDNLVNVVVSEDLGRISMDEVMRVLCPGGVAVIKEQGAWKKTVKPRLGDIDEWTHFLYDASGNAVSKDRQVGPPRHVQWLAAPKRSRDHDSLASLSALTSSGGRIFQICDEGPTSLIHHPPQWRLVARDAFNGTLLWKREIGSWLTHLYFFWSGHVQLPRRLVSIGDRVYVTLGMEAPVTALDAATGRTLLTFKESEKTEEIICHDDVLLAVIGDPDLLNREADTTWGYWPQRTEGQPAGAKSIVAYRASTGDVLWKKSAGNLAYLVPLSLAARGRRAFFLDQAYLHSVDLQTGEDLWQAPCPIEGRLRRNYVPTLVVHGDVVVVLTTKRLAAFSAGDGKKLWEKEGGNQGYASPGDLFVIGSLAWTLPATGKNDFWGIDLHTGAMEKSFAQEQVWPGGHHHRCYRNKATERYLVTGRRGVEYISVEGDRHVHNWWIRGECQYGVMPCNGLTYVPPDPCTCFNFVKVDGFRALAASNTSDAMTIDRDDRLSRGPAYSARTETGRRVPEPRDQVPTQIAREAGHGAWQPPIANRHSDDWPTYRHDITRSGSTRTRVPPNLQRKWEADIGGKLTSAVVVGDRVFIGSVDRHTVYCLDAETGTRHWQFVAAGPVDSPPTIFDNMAIFGSRDGYVYALRASDGELVWRFRGTPVDRRITVDGRLESVWPIHGSVLVLDSPNRVGSDASADARGVVYFAAGRSSYLDGGIHLHGLDAHSGKKLFETSLSALPYEPGMSRPEKPMTAALPDLLVSDGRYINMRQIQFDRRLVQRESAQLRTLFASTGLLEDCWAHRQNWCLGYEGAIGGYDPIGGLREGIRTRRPFGKLLVFDDQCAYGVQSMYTFLKHTRSMWPAAHDGELHQKYTRYQSHQFPMGVRIYAQERKPVAADGPENGKPPGKDFSTHRAGKRWDVRVPLQVRAMVLTDNVLFVAGWPDSVEIEEKTGVALDAPGRRTDRAVLWAVSPADGKKQAEYRLDSAPVFDGLVAADGRLYLSTADGNVLCFAGRASDL
ncbi:MAG: PQQ-binding-like beta-propeller repeat protein [Planctomycetes bacterium]|nr:PQQ-binding-like beta-propeller repeat protein [Planctomycetota bacterium]